jgi:hypothetical protein
MLTTRSVSTSTALTAAALVLAAGATPALAQNRDWNAGAGNWSDAFNWNPADVPDTATEIARVLNGGVATMNGNFSFGGFETSPTSEIFVESARTTTIALNSVNNGLFTLNGTVFGTVMQFPGSVTLSGSGEVQLIGGVNTAINRLGATNAAANAILTNGAQHTIRGFNSGSFGSATLAVNNLGLIVADGSNGAGSLLVDPRNSAGVQFTNDGTLRAEGGSTLTLTGSGGGEFDNTSGVIEALDGSVVELIAGATIAGGTYRTGGTGVINAQSVTLSAFDNEGLMVLQNASSVGASGIIDNTGEFRIAGSTFGTVMNIVSDTTFRGPGSIEFVGGVNTSVNRIGALSGPADLTFTNTDGHTVRARDFASLGSATANIVNNSLIVADGAGELLIDPRNAAATTMINTGTVRAENGALVTFTGSGGGAFDNTGGLIEALDGSSVDFEAGATLSGGQLSSSGSGFVSVSSASFTDVDNLGEIVLFNAGLLNASGSLNNEGLISIEGTSFGTRITLQDDVALSGSGGVNILGGLNTGVNFINAAGDFTLDIGADQTIRAFDAASLGSASLRVMNNGRVTGDGSGGGATQNLLIDPRNVPEVAFTNNGEILAENGSRVTLTGSGNGRFDNSLGVVRAADASDVFFEAGADITGGWIDSTGTGQITVSSAVLSDIVSTADVVLQNAGFLTLNGGYDNNGTITIGGTNFGTRIRAGSDVDLTGNGEILMVGGLNTGVNAIDAAGGPTPVITNGADHTIRARDFASLGAATATIVNDGAVIADGPGQLRVDPRNVPETTFFNNGTLEAINGGELLLTNSGNGFFLNSGEIRAADTSLVIFDGSIGFPNEGAIIIEPAATFRLSGFAGFLENRAAGTVFVGGELDGEFQGGGTLEVGEASGVVGVGSITDDATLNGETVFDMDAASDRLNITGSAIELGGDIRLVLGSYMPTPGESWLIIDAPGYAERFDNVISDGDGSFVLTYNADDVVATWVDVDDCGVDADGDGRTGTGDLLVLLGNWGQSVTGANTDGDFDNSGLVGTSDLLLLLSTWGRCPI